MAGKIRCVFFDRDGIVNASPGTGYVERWEDFRLMPAFVDVLRQVRAAAYEAVIVSNQRGVALGRMSKETVDTIHRNLRRDLRDDYGLDVLDMLYCPHDDAADCECRKPRPGMLLEAARRHDIDLKASWMVGDQERDIEAGRRAGCRTILVSAAPAESAADIRVTRLEALQETLADALSA